MERSTTRLPLIIENRGISLMLDVDSFHLQAFNLAKQWLKTNGEHSDFWIYDTGASTRDDIIPGYELDFTAEGSRDELGHGSFVAALIGSKQYGVCPGARIHSLKVLKGGFGYNDWTVKAMDAQINLMQQPLHSQRKHIVNMSLGSTDYDVRIEDRINKLIELDCVIVGASGNSGSEVMYPAALKQVIATGSVNKNHEVSYFSSGGSSMDTVCYGEKIIGPDLDSRPVAKSGTSFATAIASGIIGLLRSYSPDLSADEIVKLVELTAIDVHDPGFDHRTGFGLINPEGLMPIETSSETLEHIFLQQNKELLSYSLWDFVVNFKKIRTQLQQNLTKMYEQKA